MVVAMGEYHSQMCYHSPSCQAWHDKLQFVLVIRHLIYMCEAVGLDIKHLEATS